ncbi:hypothetical protein TWF718_005634 [Orbilia javanica]|uniref:Uncharacterized protein n=1 Tax=Orbilia javanica TaxID=47235 RepID=A0AAN8MS88_9PEZI
MDMGVGMAWVSAPSNYQFEVSIRLSVDGDERPVMMKAKKKAMMMMIEMRIREEEWRRGRREEMVCK